MTYDTQRSIRFQQSTPEDPRPNNQVYETSPSFQDHTQNMANSGVPWGYGDKLGFWEGSSEMRSSSSFSLLRTASGSAAYRMFTALYGAPDHFNLSWWEAYARHHPRRRQRPAPHPDPR